MEEYILLCLDCHEIFPGNENHTCRRNVRNQFAATVDERVSTFDGTIRGFSESSSVGDGTHNPTPFEERTKIISTTKENPSDEGRRDRKPILETPLQENVDFGYPYGYIDVQQQRENYREGLSVFEPELWTSNSNVTPVLQDACYNPCIVPDVANSCMSADEPMEVSLPSTSNWNVRDSSVISNGWDLIDQCEPMDLEAYRRPEDRQFVCPLCGQIIRKKYYFEFHYRTHTGEKPHACDMCDKTFNSKSNLNAHRSTHTEEKPYECDVCEFKCNTRRSLARHRILHHGETPYKCPTCGKGFTRLGNCKTHIENVHRKK